MPFTILFDATAVNFSAVLASFGAGLFPAPAPQQIDNTVRIAPYSARDIEEVTAWSIARTIHEEMVSGIMDRIVEADHDEVMDRFAEEAELARRWDSITR